MKKIFCAAVSILLLASCMQPKELVFQRMQNFGVKTAGMKQTRISVDVCMYNPNNYKLKLKDADLDVFIDGNSVGKITTEDHISIPALDTFSIPVSLDVNLQTAFPNALQMLFNGQIDLKLTGKLKASRHRIFITIPVDYESKQDLRSITN